MVEQPNRAFEISILEHDLILSLVALFNLRNNPHNLTNNGKPEVDLSISMQWGLCRIYVIFL